MTRRTGIAAASIIVTFGLVSVPFVRLVRGQTPPAGQTHQMGQMGPDQMGHMAEKGMCPMMAGQGAKAMHMEGMSGDAALEKVFAALGVTDAQQDKMKAVREQHQVEIQELTARAEAAKRALQEAIESLTFDEAAVRARITALASAVSDTALAATRVRAEAFKVLTPDQQKKAIAVQKLQRELRDLLQPPVKK